LQAKASRPRPDLSEAKATIFCPLAVLEVKDSPLLNSDVVKAFFMRQRQRPRQIS